MLDTRIVAPCRIRGSVFDEKRQIIRVPAGWEFLPAGDGPLTKLVKAKGTTWLVQVKRGKRKISQGIWADAAHIREARQEIECKRSAPDYLRKRRQAVARREKKQEEYHSRFIENIEIFLNCAPRYGKIAQELARLVAEHATPVGSGTVARTEQIPIAQRASNAVIAWMRHQTTGYDTMKISRVKGRRRQVRSELAALSVNLLDAYRKGTDTPPRCPLKTALSRHSDQNCSNTRVRQFQDEHEWF